MATGLNRFEPVKTSSNIARTQFKQVQAILRLQEPVVTGCNRFKPVKTGSNIATTGCNWLQQVQTVSNQLKPVQTLQEPGSNKFKPF